MDSKIKWFSVKLENLVFDIFCSDETGIGKKEPGLDCLQRMIATEDRYQYRNT